jgi:site-specific recombinase XerD
MKQKRILEELMERCVQYFEQHSFSAPRIDRYKYLWRNKLMPYMAKRSILIYTDAVGEEYISSELTGGIITPFERDIIRSIRVLSEFQEKGIITKRHSKPLKRELAGPIGLVMENFLQHLQSLRRNKTTIDDHRLYLYRFLTYLESKQVQNLEEIKEDHLISFLSTSTNNKIFVVSSIRLFFSYLYQERLLKSDLSESLQRFKWSRTEKLPSVYSESEVLQIEASIQRSDATGKRNYALMLLATRLGLRASDIAHLSFSNMDWENNTMVLSQFKTGQEIKLPLLTSVGEALIDYLKYARKRSESDRIFLYTRAPFSPMRGAAVSGALGQVIYASGVDITNRKHGPHAMRHSLACRFLENKEPMPVISEALGHQSTDTTMSYLRIDITSLRQCALDVPPVTNHFYEQKGGIFYE